MSWLHCQIHKGDRKWHAMLADRKFRLIEHTQGYYCLNSASSSIEYSKRCLISIPCAALCITFKLPSCSMVAKYTA